MNRVETLSTDTSTTDVPTRRVSFSNKILVVDDFESTSIGTDSSTTDDDDTSITNDDEDVPTRRVSFSDKSQMFVVDDLRQLGIERPHLWYSLSDILDIKDEHRQMVQDIRAKLSQQAARPDIVGLEKYLSSDLSREFKRRKRQVYSAVTSELEFQNEFLKEINPDRLATVSSHHTKWAMEQAHYAAQLLEQDVLLSSPTVDKDCCRAVAA